MTGAPGVEKRAARIPNNGSELHYWEPPIFAFGGADRGDKAAANGTLPICTLRQHRCPQGTWGQSVCGSL